MTPLPRAPAPWPASGSLELGNRQVLIVFWQQLRMTHLRQVQELKQSLRQILAQRNVQSWARDNFLASQHRHRNVI